MIKMERHFDEELDILKNSLMEMAALTDSAIRKAVGALQERNCALSKSVIEGDRRINELEIKIEEHAVDLIARRQPLAGDLRFITTGMKLNAELERIGDLAVNVAQRVMDICSSPALPGLSCLMELTDIAGVMVKRSIESFVTGDTALARDIIAMDERADAFRNKTHKDMVQYIRSDVNLIDTALPVILMARHLERICDHASYIAEDVVYMVEAENIKHK